MPLQVSRLSQSRRETRMVGLPRAQRVDLRTHGTKPLDNLVLNRSRREGNLHVLEEGHVDRFDVAASDGAS